MKRANSYKQNSPHWYTWRNKGIGASDAASLLDESPWTSKFQLWAQKTGLLPRGAAPSFAVSAMERGKLLEPVARAYYEKKFGLIVEQDVNCEDEEHEFLRASLDGLVTNGSDQFVLEIKCPGKAAHAKALRGELPDYYYPQLQFQLMVTGLPYAHYFSFDGKEGPDPIVVGRDEPYISMLRAAAVELWGMVQSHTPPSPTAKDVAGLVKELGEVSARQSALTNALEVAFNEFAGTKPKRRGSKEPLAKVVGGEEMEEIR